MRLLVRHGMMFEIWTSFCIQKGKKSEESDDSDSVSIGIRGPVTIQNAVSLQPVSIYSQQITKSVNLETDPKDPDKKGSDTMGMKHRVDYGVYVIYGSISCQLAEKLDLGRRC